MVVIGSKNQHPVKALVFVQELIKRSLFFTFVKFRIKSIKILRI